MAEKTNFNNKWLDLSFSVRIARRYLFSKKSHNAINIISAISAIGVAIGTMALVVVLSVFNGFEGLISDMFSAFDPELRISLSQGKSFDLQQTDVQKVKQLKSIAIFTEIVEENALLRFKDKQMPATVKGVSENYAQLTEIKKIISDGKFELFDGAFERIVPGVGVANTLGLSAFFVDPIFIYAPKRNSKINLLRPETSFNQTACFASGIFTTNQVQYDDKYVLVSLKQARQLFDYDSTVVTAIELKLISNSKIDIVKKEIESILGPNYQVKNRFEQQESFFKIMKIEKWITFLILSFILLIASFNIIGSLSMLIIDKKSDISTLESLGANKKQIRRIFLFEGWMISATGAIFGIILGTAICLLQEFFGLLKLGNGFVVDAYPISTNFMDIVLIFFTVLFMGFIAALYPVKYLK
jgi:ABC-type lipoprotein release transport system permease subunit